MGNDGTPYGSARVHQASGMVSVQAACTPDEALALMEARAVQIDRTLAEIALGVIDHSITFD
jgi:AmiR/NasT family two-component response regulator